MIGGGISGLACAYRLQQLGVPVRCSKPPITLGGLIGTVEKDGFLFESGPQSFQGTDTLLQLISELGIEQRSCRGRSAGAALRSAPRQAAKNSRCRRRRCLRSSLLSVRSRWKIASEPLRRTKPPSEEESVANFVRRKFGHEILEYLVAPFVSGVYAGDPEKLSLRAAFPTLEEWERRIRQRAARRDEIAAEKGAQRAAAALLVPARNGHAHGTLPEKLGDSVRSGTRAVSVGRVNQTRRSATDI